MDGSSQKLNGNLAAIGAFEVSESFRLRVSGENVQYFFLLLGDEEDNVAGLVAGGGHPESIVDYSVNISGDYFLFIQYDPKSAADARTAMVELDEQPAPAPSPPRQLVQLVFTDGFLHSPGLWDPVDGTNEDLAFLEAISDIVRNEVAQKLQDIFAGTPIEILHDTDSTSDEPVSRITFSPERVLADQSTINDSALPPPDPSRPECQIRVVFGEVLPSGTTLDPGNQIHDDEAVVYVGSFQGRGESCWTSTVGSINSVVLTLAQTAAHEIGHLVGLHHVEQIDLMNRSATLAFLRDLEFARGQLQLDRLRDGQIVSDVFTAVVIDPDVYFQAVFGTIPADVEP